MFTLRPYQKEAVESVYNYLRHKDGNPCVVLPTASGKTPCMAAICKDAVNLWNGRVLVLAHVKELLEQTADTLSAIDPGLDIGIYSAGLKNRDTEHQIIIAGIQSVYKRACELGPFDLVLIDESHMLPPDGEGTYRSFLKDMKVINPNVRVVGLTATPFRMTTGMICGPDNILNEICFEIGVRELIVEGYLCPLKSKSGKRKIDVSGLHIRGGEFISAEVEQLMNDESLVYAACREIIEHTHNRSSVLIFTSGVGHARHIRNILQQRCRQEVGLLTGNTPAIERSDLLDRFKGKVVKDDLFGNDKSPLKYLVNVNVLSTGFDAPNIDCVVLLRPTMSPGLYYQMVGRGFRLHPSKDDCLVLDFGGNILRHGPVDAIKISDNKKQGGSDAPAKECPKCNSIIHAAYSICPDCGYVFPLPDKNKHDSTASTAGVLSGQIEDTDYNVQSVKYYYHIKRNAGPDDCPTMRIEYQIGLGHWIKEWVCFEHTGYARNKAEIWWRQRGNEPVPGTVKEAVTMAGNGSLAETKVITVRSISGQKFDRIVNCVLGPKPSVYDESLERQDDELPEYIYADDGEIPF